MIKTMQTTHLEKLGYNTVLEQLSHIAVSSNVKEKCLDWAPSYDKEIILHQMAETTEAKKLMAHLGTPPVPQMADLQDIIKFACSGGMLTPGQLSQVLQFLSAVKRMKNYLKRGEEFEINLSLIGRSFMDCDPLWAQLEGAILHEQVQDNATARLQSIRNQVRKSEEEIKKKTEELLKKNKQYVAENFIALKNGRYTLPVKKEHKNKVPGQVVEISSRGATLFIEPAAVSKWQEKYVQLCIEEENEVRIILYTLTDLVAAYETELERCRETMESLDFAFAKGKLSMDMDAGPVQITEEREIFIVKGRHPSMRLEKSVPLDFYANEGNRGVIITGPNTGGKTVALKTVGLLALMAQSGFHIPAAANSRLPVFKNVLCDLGDGQSITESLSTFSAHMKNIIEVLQSAGTGSLILLDELGSGTDPSEGMGLALAIVEELAQIGCLFVVTTHYPQLKDYAAGRKGLQNARMAFDKESLTPLYRLEIGEGGESCAFYIARKMGLKEHILARAQEAAGAEKTAGKTPFLPPREDKRKYRHPQRMKKKMPAAKAQSGGSYQRGDNVLVHPEKKMGIVYQAADEKGMVGVQVKGEKIQVNWKRLSLYIKADQLYPEDYDFSVIFDSVEVRKARKIMGKRHEEGNEIVTE